MGATRPPAFLNERSILGRMRVCGVRRSVPESGLQSFRRKVFGSRSSEAERICAFFAETEQADQIIASLRRLLVPVPQSHEREHA